MILAVGKMIWRVGKMVLPVADKVLAVGRMKLPIVKMVLPVGKMNLPVGTMLSAIAQIIVCLWSVFVTDHYYSGCLLVAVVITNHNYILLPDKLHAPVVGFAVIVAVVA